MMPDVLRAMHAMLSDPQTTLPAPLHPPQDVSSPAPSTQTTPTSPDPSTPLAEQPSSVDHAASPSSQQHVPTDSSPNPAESPIVNVHDAAQINPHPNPTLYHGSTHPHIQTHTQTQTYTHTHSETHTLTLALTHDPGLPPSTPGHASAESLSDFLTVADLRKCVHHRHPDTHKTHAYTTP